MELLLLGSLLSSMFFCWYGILTDTHAGCMQFEEYVNNYTTNKMRKPIKINTLAWMVVGSAMKPRSLVNATFSMLPKIAACPFKMLVDDSNPWDLGGNFFNEGQGAKVPRGKESRSRRSAWNFRDEPANPSHKHSHHSRLSRQRSRPRQTKRHRMLGQFWRGPLLNDVTLCKEAALVGFSEDTNAHKCLFLFVLQRSRYDASSLGNVLLGPQSSVRGWGSSFRRSTLKSRQFMTIDPHWSSLIQRFKILTLSRNKTLP